MERHTCENILFSDWRSSDGRSPRSRLTDEDGTMLDNSYYLDPRANSGSYGIHVKNRQHYDRGGYMDVMLEAGMVGTDKLLVAGRLDAQSAQLSTIQSIIATFLRNPWEEKLELKVRKTPTDASPIPMVEETRSAR